MSRFLRTLAAFLAVATAAFGQTQCSDYNTITTVYWEPTGTQNHASGMHYVTSSEQGSCTYTTIGLPQWGIASSSTAPSLIMADEGTLTNVSYSHNLGVNWSGGASSSPNGGVTASSGVTNAATVTACLLTCAATISFSGGAYGVGTSVSFPPSAIF